jgi:hypothetical protein
MADQLLTRLDKYVIALLDEAERPDCDEAAKGDTQEPSEEGPGSRPRVAFTDRINALKAATAYLQVRAGKMMPEEPEKPEPSEFERNFVTRLRPKSGARRR